MRFLLFTFIFGSSLAYGRSYNILYPLSEDEVMSVSSMASAKEEGLRTLSETTKEERLFDAVRRSNLKEVRKLLKEGADPNVADKNGRIMLNYVTDVRVARALLDHGADPKAKDRFGIAPLHNVANIKIAKVFLDAGANPNAKDKFDIAPLHLLVVDEVIKQVELLLKNDAKLNAREALDGVIKQVELLFKNAADSDVRAKLSELRLTKLLLDKGADPNAKDRFGRPPFQILTDSVEGFLPDIRPACRGAFN